MLKKLKSVLKTEIKHADKVYIIGHNYSDLDAFGAAIAISLIVSKLNKKSYIILDDKVLEKSVNKALSSVKNKFNFIKSNTISDDLNNSLLIVVDTNKKYMLSVDTNKFSKVIVIDHHDTDKNTIATELSFIDTKKSSTCEIATDLLNLFKVKIDKTTSNIILSGIVLDTNNFILRATCDTFKSATYLLLNGASTTSVQYLLKQDIKKFINRQKMLSNVSIVNNNIAIAKGVKGDSYRREDLAKTAETLLLFEKIDTSFVIGNLNSGEIGISGRTLGKLNMGKIFQKLGGGGNSTEGATIIKDSDIKSVYDMLINTLK